MVIFSHVVNDGVHRDLLLLTPIVSCFFFLFVYLRTAFYFIFYYFLFLNLCPIPMLTRTSNPPLMPPIVRGALSYMPWYRYLYLFFGVCPIFKARTTASFISSVTQPLYESRMNWVHDYVPPASRRPMENIDDAPTTAITMKPPEAPCTQPQPKKSRRRRRRKNHRSANQNLAHCSTAPVTPDECWANRNSASIGSTRPKPAANDLPGR